jgi:hypothetical protein
MRTYTFGVTSERMVSSRLLAIALVTLLVIGLRVPLSSAASDIGQVLLDERPDRRLPCPDLMIAEYPSEIHFTPGLVEHESWLEFTLPPRFDGSYALCFEGRQMEAGRGLDYSSRGIVRVSVHTRLVDLYWLLHTLDGFADPSRWELRLAFRASDHPEPGRAH